MLSSSFVDFRSVSGGTEDNGATRFVHGVDYSEIAHSQRVVALKLTSEAFPDVRGLPQELDHLKNAQIDWFSQFL